VLGHDLTRVRLRAAELGKSSYRRVAVVDAQGRKAWSNPFWPDAH
jgi:stalled ribosome alternative rescue factor ArfA